MTPRGRATDQPESRIRPNGYLTPNLYVDKIMHLLTGEEWKCLSYALRRIYGFNKRQDQISMTQFDGGTLDREGNALDHGTGLVHSANVKAVRALVEFNILVIVQKGVPDRAGKTGQSTVYAINEDDTTINWDALYTRNIEKQLAGAAKTKAATAARAAKRAAPPGTSDIPGTSHVPGPGTSHVPGPGTSHVLNNIQGNTEKYSEAPDGETPPGPPPAALSKGRKRKSQADPRTNHPAIQAVRSVIGKYPSKQTYDVLIRRLGEQPDIEKLRAVYSAWCLAGLNPQNLGGVLDWYEQGIPQRGQKGQPAATNNTYESVDAYGNPVRVEWSGS